MANRSIISLNIPAAVNGVVLATQPINPGDGADITPWRTNNLFSAGIGSVFIVGAACTITKPTGGVGGVELWGYAMSKWWFAGVLHDGADIPIVGVNQGFMQQLEVLGSFERLCVAGFFSAGAPTVTFVPIEAYQ